MENNLPQIDTSWTLFLDRDGVLNKKIDDEVLHQFNTLLQNGFMYLEEVISENTLSYFDVNDYLKNKIEYNLNDEKRKAIELYLQKAALYR